MKNDPCFRCTLPDCDDTSLRCQLRKLSNSYFRKIGDGAGDQVLPEERQAYNTLFKVYHLERMAQAAEGVRPYGRYGSPWKPGDPAPEARP